MWYDLGPDKGNGQMRDLEARGCLTTTIDQVALAFTAPKDLPPSKVYENAIRKGLEHA